MAELTGQSSSVKSGEIAHIDALRELCSEHCEDANEKASRVTGVSSNGEFWILRVLETIRRLEGMPKHVHIAFPVDDQDETGNRSIDKAQETLTILKTVCQTLAMDTISVAHCSYRWTTRTNTPSAVLSCFWQEPSYNSTVLPVEKKTMRMRMGRM